jgi:hypothetical protein
MNINKLIAAVLTIISLLTSFIFISYGARAIFREAVPAWIIVFAI